MWCCSRRAMASYDMFASAEARGEAFAAAVNGTARVS